MPNSPQKIFNGDNKNEQIQTHTKKISFKGIQNETSIHSSFQDKQLLPQSTRTQQLPVSQPSNNQIYNLLQKQKHFKATKLNLDKKYPLDLRRDNKHTKLTQSLRTSTISPDVCTLSSPVAFEGQRLSQSTESQDLRELIRVSEKSQNYISQLKVIDKLCNYSGKRVDLIKKREKEDGELLNIDLIQFDSKHTKQSGTELKNENSNNFKTQQGAKYYSPQVEKTTKISSQQQLNSAQARSRVYLPTSISSNQHTTKFDPSKTYTSTRVQSSVRNSLDEDKSTRYPAKLT